MCVVRFAHVCRSLCSGMNLVAVGAFALLMCIVRFAHDCFGAFVLLNLSLEKKGITSLSVGEPVVGDVQWIKSTSSLRSDGTFLFFTSLIRERMHSFKNKKAPVLSNKCF